jgi:hypothetical protein
MVWGMTTTTPTDKLTIAAPYRGRAVSTAVAVQRTTDRRHAQAARARVVYRAILLPIGTAALIGLVLLSLTLISYFTHLPS